jgi:tetratricopeptide (TPR) repeat protein
VSVTSVDALPEMVSRVEPLGSSPRPRVWPWVLLVTAVGCAVFAQTASYGFAYDDVGVIQDRSLFHSLANWRAILTASWWPVGNLYRPLTQLTFAANWTATGGTFPAFHLTNLVLHGIASGLVYLLALRLVGARGALVAALLFAVHPVHVEAVANVVGRAEVLATIFSALAVLAYLTDGRLADAGDDRSWRRYLTSFGTLGATGLALASKESAFALPALLLLADWFDAGRRGRRSIGVERHWVLWLGVIGVTLGWLLWRSRLVGDLTGLETAAGLDDDGFFERTLVMLPIVLQYVRLLFAPLRLSADYNPNFINPASSLTWTGAFGLLVVVAALALAWSARRRAPGVTFALGWMAGTLLIVANILVPTGVLLAERTLYLPSVGAVLLLALAWDRCRERWPKLAMVGLAVVLGAGVVRTTTRNPVWRDNDTLFRQLVRDAPGSFHAKAVEARLAANRGNFRASERLFRDALAIYPLAWTLWKDLGQVLDSQGRFAEASDCWWAAWRLNPNAVLTAQRAIQTAIIAGRVDTAAARLAIARAARPQSGELILAEADVVLAQGKPRRAMTLRRQVAWQYPDSARFWGLTAEAALKARHCPELMRSLGRLRALHVESSRIAALEAGARECR